MTPACAASRCGIWPSDSTPTSDGSENPLEPLDASSPRAAYESFLEQAQVIEDAALAYRSDRSLETQRAYSSEVAKTAQLADLSNVAEASLDEVVARNFAALADILMRIPLPDTESIPDADMVAADELTQWTLPGTEITFKPLRKGDRKGGWVLSASSVAGLPGWRESVEDFPVLVEDVAIEDWRRNRDFTTGPLIPGDLIRSLPDVANTRVLGSPLWKSVVAVLGAMLIVLLAVLWHRWIRKLNGTQLTVPNSDIVQARISNFTQRTNALFLHTIGLRYETTIEQIEWLVAQIRDELRDHPRVERDDDMPRVRLAAFGASSIDVEARAYVETTSIHEFMAVQEQLLAMIMRLVEAAGTSLGLPLDHGLPDAGWRHRGTSRPGRAERARAR